MVLVKRWLHTATLINNKLYILCGNQEKGQSKEFIYLDFSGPLKTQNLLWQLSSIGAVPAHYGAASVKGGANNNTLFLYGGNPDFSDSYSTLVHVFDPQSNTWLIPTITPGASIVNKRSNLMGIIDYNGKMYLWSGRLLNLYVNEMLILDTVNLNWGKGSLVDAPAPSINYGATLLPNQKIIYIGGYSREELITPNQVYMYDTINDNWDIKITFGKVPSSRDAFSTVLGLDGQRVIIFGGLNNKSTLTLDDDSLYVLDLIDFKWYIPKKISGKIPSSRAFHKANVIGKYMVVSFGQGIYDQLNESNILLLDISNNDEYIWTDQFIPLPPPDPQATSQATPSNAALQSPQTDNKPVIIGVTLGIICCILLGIGTLFLYKRVKNRNVIPTPGNEGSGYNSEGLVVPTERNIYNQGQVRISVSNSDSEQKISRNESATNHEPIEISAPVTKENYNHRQGAISIANDERLSLLSLQNIDDLKNEIRQEIKNEVRQEIKNEVKQEIIREMLQDLQNDRQAP